jgi:hypothetical protein
MKTRSQVVEIDFDAASAAWKANKVPKGNGTYAYKCNGILRSGDTCSQKAVANCDFCKRHNKDKK